MRGTHKALLVILVATGATFLFSKVGQRPYEMREVTAPTAQAPPVVLDTSERPIVPLPPPPPDEDVTPAAPSGTITPAPTGAVEAEEPEEQPPPQRTAIDWDREDDTIATIGARLTPHVDGARVVSIVPGSGAASAGLARDDVIVSIEGEDISGFPVEDVMQKLQGPPNSRVKITFNRASGTTRTERVARLTTQ